MTKRAVTVEGLLGCQVYDQDGNRVGRVEEIVAETRGEECLIREYHVGERAMTERFAAWGILHVLLNLVTRPFGRRGTRGYRIPWDKLDLSSPDRPALTCSTEDLEALRG